MTLFVSETYIAMFDIIWFGIAMHYENMSIQKAKSIRKRKKKKKKKKQYENSSHAYRRLNQIKSNHILLLSVW